VAFFWAWGFRQVGGLLLLYIFASWRWAGRSMGYLWRLWGKGTCGAYFALWASTDGSTLRDLSAPCTYSLQSVSLRLQLSRAQMPREIIFERKRSRSCEKPEIFDPRFNTNPWSRVFQLRLMSPLSKSSLCQNPSLSIPPHSEPSNSSSKSLNPPSPLTPSHHQGIQEKEICSALCHLLGEGYVRSWYSPKEHFQLWIIILSEIDIGGALDTIDYFLASLFPIS